MIELEFIGAARTVTGSKHLLRTSKASVLLDCGLFQGHRQEAFEKNRNIPVDVKKIDAVVLSHAHIDHSGALPALYKMGYRGSIFATPATRDLCSPMLMDTANIMRSDAVHIEKLISKGVQGLTPAEPLYDQDDVIGTLGLMVGLPYHRKQLIAPGIELTLIDAGHILGSAICVLDIEDAGEHKRLAFTGDLGRKHLPILRDPEIPEGVSCLLMESTYGDRRHDPIEPTSKALSDAINHAFKRGGKIVVPTFALERAQEIIYILKKLREKKEIPNIPVYVDSPLTVKLTDVFKLHPECYDLEFFEVLHGRESPFEFPGLTYVSSVEDSKRIDSEIVSSVILSASGMCEGGRILHHLQATIEDPKNMILIVGYQAEHTLGRGIVEKRSEVKIFGQAQALNAEVRVLNGFSAHADQTDLIAFAQAVAVKGNLERIVLVHGEHKAQEALSQQLTYQKFQQVNIPKPGETIEI
ncbi:MAG: MBL fold metallo-hydrolase [Myxococcaceae bacterium]